MSMTKKNRMIGAMESSCSADRQHTFQLLNSAYTSLITARGGGVTVVQSLPFSKEKCLVMQVWGWDQFLDSFSMEHDLTLMMHSVGFGNPHCN